MADGDERCNSPGAARAGSSGSWSLPVIAAASGVQGSVVTPLTLAGLSIASLPRYIALWPRARQASAEREWLLTVALSMFNNLATACATFLLGNLIRWI